MRRTARTQLGALGIDPFVAERALNHKLRGTQGIYDRHDYLPQRRQALAQWATLLGSLSQGQRISASAEVLGPGHKAVMREQFLGRLSPQLLSMKAAND